MKTIEDLRNHPVYKRIEQHPDLDDEPLSRLEEEFLNNPDVKTSMEKYWDNVGHLVNWFEFDKSKYKEYWWRLRHYV